jgi:hypothetical protein
MLVKMLVSCAGSDDGKFISPNVGDVIELSDATAKEFVAIGYAEAVETVSEETPAPKPKRKN